MSPASLCLPTIVALAVLPWGSSLSAQVIDEGVFSVRRAGLEIGREKFTISSGRGPDGKTAGTTISSVARYPAVDPATTITAVLERSISGQFTVIQLEYQSRDHAEQYLGAQDRGRITIHRFSDDEREAREYRGGAAAYVMADSVFALFQVMVDLASAEGATVIAYVPRQGVRRRITATAVADHRVLLGGDFEAAIQLDSANRIERVEIPGISVSVVRLRD